MNESVVVDKNITESDLANYKESYRVYLKEKSKRQQMPCFRVTSTAYLICKSLFLSNNEFNSIIGFYLSVWSKNQDKQHVLKANLQEYFRKETKGFIDHFFQNDQILCNDFILFVCFFLFYSIPDIVSVLISMCGVNSNIIITKDKIELFFHYFNLNLLENEKLLKVMDKTKGCYTDDKKAYDIKTFHLYMIDNYTLVTALQILKNDLINNIFVVSPLNRIYTRINYYSIILNSCNDEMSVLPLLRPPKESCLANVLRLICTHDPDPYYFDFYITTPIQKVKSLIICQLKMRFGYSQRPRLTHFLSLQSKSITLRNGMISPITSPKKEKEVTLETACYSL